MILLIVILNVLRLLKKELTKLVCYKNLIFNLNFVLETNTIIKFSIIKEYTLFGVIDFLLFTLINITDIIQDINI